jgi:2'-5' RNA ligase
VHDDEMASGPAEYWARRRELSPSPRRSAVADGDRRLSVLVDVDDDALARRYDRLRRRLDRFDCLSTTPPDDLHLTVKLLDDAPDPGTARDLLDRVAARTDPFRASFPRLNLFPDTVYAETDAGGALARLNRRFCAAAETTEVDRDGDGFVPHLTLGYFGGDADYHDVVDFVARERRHGATRVLPPVTVEALSLVSFDTAAGRPTVAETVATRRLDG